MKLSEKTINVLKNFSSVSPAILFREGNVVRTMSPLKTIYAKATVPDDFTKKFAVYDLSQFIGTVSIFNEPELTFADKHVTISDKTKKIDFTYTPEELIKVAAEKDPALPSVDVSFKFNSDSIKDAVRALGVLKLPEIAIVGDGTSIFIQAIDSKNPTAHVYSEQVGDTDKTFRAIFKVENITKVISGEYVVDICMRGISHFTGTDIEYWIGVEAGSAIN